MIYLGPITITIKSVSDKLGTEFSIKTLNTVELIGVAGVTHAVLRAVSTGVTITVGGPLNKPGTIFTVTSPTLFLTTDEIHVPDCEVTDAVPLFAI